MREMPIANVTARMVDLQMEEKVEIKTVAALVEGRMAVAEEGKEEQFPLAREREEEPEVLGGLGIRMTVRVK